jgi:hypothetical protein
MRAIRVGGRHRKLRGPLRTSGGDVAQPNALYRARCAPCRQHDRAESRPANRPVPTSDVLGYQHSKRVRFQGLEDVCHVARVSDVVPWVKLDRALGQADERSSRA